MTGHATDGGTAAVVLEGAITEQDYVGAQWLHYRSRLWLIVLAMLLAGWVTVRAALLFHAWWRGTYPDLGGLAYVLVPVLAAAYWFVLYPLRYRRSYRKHPGVREPFRMEWSDEGLDVTSELGGGRMPWRLFVKYREGRDLFLVYQSPVLFNIVPRRLLAEGDADRLRSLLERHLGRKGT